jgi:hypothetical protein
MSYRLPTRLAFQDSALMSPRAVSVSIAIRRCFFFPTGRLGAGRAAQSYTTDVIIRLPGPGVVNFSRVLFTPSLLPLACIESTV